MTTRTRWTILPAAVALLLLVWRVSPVPSPPLYDGVQLPNEPYRYLQPPTGHAVTKHPTSARLEILLPTGLSPTLFVQTGEQSSQARLDLNAGAFRLAQPAQVLLTIQPVLPPAQTADGRFDGNVYRFAAVSAGRAPLRLAPGTARISLRGTGQTGSPVIEQYVAGRWQRLPTTFYPSTDYFVVSASTLGDFALVFARGASAKQGEDNTLLLLAFVFSVIVTVVVSAIIVIRLVRRGRTRPPVRKR